MSDDNKDDKIRAVQRKVDEVKNIMNHRIEEILKHGEKLEEMHTCELHLHEPLQYNKYNRKNNKTQIMKSICLAFIVSFIVYNLFSYRCIFKN